MLKTKNIENNKTPEKAKNEFKHIDVFGFQNMFLNSLSEIQDICRRA